MLNKSKVKPKKKIDYYKEYLKYKHLAGYFEDKYNNANHWLKHFKTQFAPGHFYSPYPDIKDIRKRRSQIFDRSKRKLPGIDINEKQQLQLLGKIAKHYEKWPYQQKRKYKKYRYYLDYHAFSHTDAVILFCLLNELKPRKIVEIGSGYSSALLMDYNEHFNDYGTMLHFIEPFPELLLSLLKEGDKGKYTLSNKGLHDADLGPINLLESGDVLFVDSTHVAKPGSDVNQIFFNILPLLKKGVIVHIHDIFYPFEYPYEWVEETRAWNENYIVRAFLYNNPDFKIMLFNNFINEHHTQLLGRLMPLSAKNHGGSLWLQKIN